jgi:predicted SnoaL-like aldol condensation-catalyzing enzyme
MLKRGIARSSITYQQDKESTMKMAKCLGTLTVFALAAASVGSISTAAADGNGRSDDKACTVGQAQLDRNVRTAIAYYTLAFNAGEPRLAVEKYVGVDANGNKVYTQHNPFAQNGPEAFIAFVEFFKGLFPELHVDIKRTIPRCSRVKVEPGRCTVANRSSQA